MQGQGGSRIDRTVAAFAFLLAACGHLVANGALAAEDRVNATGKAGGLCVQLGGADGTRTVNLARRGYNLVHRLDNDATRVASVRKIVQDAGLYGPVSVEHWTSTSLPYADNLVNLIVVDHPMGIPRQELMRVLCPNGVAHIRRGETYQVLRKPRSPKMGEWTHQWHGPDGNLVAEDQLVGVPTGIQWIAGPLFAMAGRKSSTQSLVSAGGRNFYVTQNVLANVGQDSMPQYLVARDAFNGLLLWMQPWAGPFVTGSGETNPRIVALGDRVYIVGEKVAEALHAATGKMVLAYPTDDPPQKLLCIDGILLIETEEGITAFAADSAQRRWRHSDRRISSTVVADGRVHFLSRRRAKDGQWAFQVVCLSLTTGEQRWRVSTESWAAGSRQRITFAKDGYLAVQSHGALHLLSAANGAYLWGAATDARPGKDYADERFVGHFFQHGLVWLRTTTSAGRTVVSDSRGLLLWDAAAEVQSTGASKPAAATTAEFGKTDEQLLWLGLDPATGTLERELLSRGSWPDTATPGKLGCQLMLACDRFVIIPRQAALVDFKTGEKSTFKFARGGCGLGAVAAHGLLYVHPHACGCYSEALRGFIALHSSRVSQDASRLEPRLLKGAAYGAEINNRKTAVESIDQWTTYRHDGRRSARTPNVLPVPQRLKWTTPITDSSSSRSLKEWKLRVGNTITPPVIAGGKAFVASPDNHALVAVDVETGAPIWRFTANGRINAPPTIFEGLCLFGAHDGYLYCLRADDGEMVWRFRAAPTARRIVAFGQIESAWPVSGAVLVQDGLAYVAAGRSPDADGGIHVCAVEPRTGNLVWSETIAEGFFGLSDCLVGDGQSVYLSNWQFDPKTGKNRRADKKSAYLRSSKMGLVEPSWTKMVLALRKGIHDWHYRDATAQLLAFSSSETFGYRSSWASGDLFSDGTRRWSLRLPAPSQIEAMLLSRDILFVAGTRDRSHGDRSAGFLWSLSTVDGQKYSEIALPAPPVFDGLAAADGHLFVATQDGRLNAFEGN